MFSIGDLIVYGNNGVCRVECIGPAAVGGADQNVDYYTLLPLFASRSKIMTPINNDRVVMRPVITRAEASRILRNIRSAKCIEVENEKLREDTYKNVMKSCDCAQIVGLLKTIEVRRVQRIAEGKKITANDEKYFNLAIDKLSGELAVALEKDKDEIKIMVTDRVRE